jgi:hypothetical protein
VPSTVSIVLRQSGSRLDEIPEGARKPPSAAVRVVAEDSTHLIKKLMELDMIQACPTFWYVIPLIGNIQLKRN